MSFRGEANHHPLSPKTNPQQKIKVGVCAMAKKVKSKPMQALLQRLEEFGIFTIVSFKQEMILESPVETWPAVDVLIAFYSDGFPLRKAEEYVLFHPQIFAINDVASQNLLFDRREVYQVLVKAGVPVPRHVFCNRGGDPKWPDSQFEEFEDHIVCDGVTIKKPFVEKPVSGEDHNVYM